jgi:hypothetical protein
MSDSSIPSDILDRDTIKSRQAEERQALFREQSEWYRLNAGTSLCDCSNCVNARKLKAGKENSSTTTLSSGSGSRWFSSHEYFDSDKNPFFF